MGGSQLHLTWWTAHTTIDGEILAVDDLNGDGTDDLLVYGLASDGTRGWPRVELRDGRTGAERWGYDIATVA